MKQIQIQKISQLRWGRDARRGKGSRYGLCFLAILQFQRISSAQAMADLLTRPEFGFAVKDVVLHTNPDPLRPRPGLVILPAAQTSRDGILAELAQKAGAQDANALLSKEKSEVSRLQNTLAKLGPHVMGIRSVVSDLLEFFEGKHPPRPGLTRVSVGSLGYWLLRPTN